MQKGLYLRTCNVVDTLKKGLAAMLQNFTFLQQNVKYCNLEHYKLTGIKNVIKNIQQVALLFTDKGEKVG